jgi:hypothetical protein
MPNKIGITFAIKLRDPDKFKDLLLARQEGFP